MVVEHIASLVLEDVAGYIKRIRQTICRQANERWIGNDANNLKYLISGLMNDWGLNSPNKRKAPRYDILRSFFVRGL